MTTTTSTTSNPMQYRDYKPETQSLLDDLKAAGFTIRGCDNGETRAKYENPDFMAELLATDEVRLYVTAPDGAKLILFLVFGNEPGELVCDYETHPALDAVVSANADKWEGRPQPMEDR